MTLTSSLRAALHDMTHAVHGVRSVLLLYDDLAGGFSVVAALGSARDTDIDGVVVESNHVLTDVLEHREISRISLDSELLDAVPILAHTVGPGPALVVPLWGVVEVGVIVIRGSDLDLDSILPDPDWLADLAALAAQALIAARPDVDHWCRFREILEVDPGGLAVVEGDDGRISYANLAFRQTVGLEGVPLLGRSIDRAVIEAPGPTLRAGLRHVRATAATFHQPQLEITDQFGPRFYALQLVPERGNSETGDAIFILLWNRTDAVTTRMALENSVGDLADSRSLLSAVLDSTNNGILLIGSDGTVLYANRRTAELLDLDAKKLVGRSQTDVAEAIKDRTDDPDAFAARQEYLSHRLEEKRFDQVEVIRPIHRILDRYSGPVYKQDSTLLGRIEVYTDVTDVKQLQRDKDEFLAVVSHELKTPVTSIKGYAQLLGRRAHRQQLQASTIAAFDVIERQANRMQQLIDTLLDLSRWDLGKLTFELREINLAALVRRAAELAGMTDDLRRIELQLPQSPVWILGDERRMEQVVTNLLLNAVRYSPGGEEVSVSLHVGNEVCLTVLDRGIGIAPEAQPRIFDRFYRGAGMTDLTGLGIGLYISKNIVEQHGGRIEVSSTVGVGSTFTVFLPAHHRVPPDSEISR